MFLRKLTVIVLPIVILWALISLADALQSAASGNSYNWLMAGFAVICGLILSLAPMIAGERRSRLPFTRQLWVPAGILLALLIVQLLAAAGQATWLPNVLQVRTERGILLEGIACGALAGRAIRG
ncbi:MAG: hypothetical protein IK127_05725 [Clostridia bacterium]|nr:hypothetical protein [Clostridia bacterium]